MIRTLFIIAGAALVLATASIGGAMALGGRDLARNGWVWTIHDGDDTVRFERQRGAPADEPTTTRTLAWTGSDRLILSLPADVEYVQGAQASVVVTGPKSAVDRVRLNNGELDMDSHTEVVVFGWNSNGLTASSDSDRLRIVVTAPSVTRFDLDGSGELAIRDYDQETLTLNVSGSGSATAQGRAATVSVDVSGSGEVDLTALTATDASVDVSGSGEATVGPTGEADVDISGSGNVTLTRKPTRQTVEISGSGEVHGG